MVEFGILSVTPLRKFLAALALLLGLCFPVQGQQSVWLAWNPNLDPTVTGYMLSYGTNSLTYDNQLDAGNNLTIEVSGLLEGQTNYFVVAAYNAEGVQGPASTPFTYVVPGGSGGSQAGSLQVTLNLAGSQWAVDGGALQSSGAIVSGLSVGWHTVSFTEASGWITPSSQTISIADGQTNSISATYAATAQTGALEVTLNVPGAQWVVDNGAWQHSGAIVAGLSAGWHTVMVSAASGWIAPTTQTIFIAAGQTNSISATYAATAQTGALEVTLNLPGSQWAVDNGAWHNSGATVSGLSVGLHMVTFSRTIGWTTPASQTISIVANQTNSIAANFMVVQLTGSLQVTLNLAGAQWAVDHGAWQSSGATVSGLPVGLHTVTFGALNGWTTPASQVISVAANQTTFVTAPYVATPAGGSLQLTLNPAMTQWAVDNGPWQNSGATVSGLSVGLHTVTFNALNGWTTPASRVISIAANQTTIETATYVAIPPAGSLQVTVSPAVTQWAVDHGAWQNSGATVSGLSVGLHTITFSALSGWTAPASRVVSVAANQTTFITAPYVAVAPIGSLQVTLNPAMTQWAVDHGAWQNSGATVSGLSAGLHTITFSALNGWTTPASRVISVAANQTTFVTTPYVAIAPTGSLQVALNPAVTQWAVDNGVWQNSGATVSGLSVGLHTVTFGALNGWTTPASQVISVAANRTTSVTAMYVATAPVGSLQVTLNPAVTQWAVDHGTLQNSGATVSGLSAGLHTITFTALNGWTTPASQVISVAANRTTSVTANYVAVAPTGSLQVTLNPAVTQWEVDHGTLQNSGATVSGLSAGLHTITFTALNGWTTPASQTISVAANRTTSVTAMYVPILPTGSLQVTLNPAVTQWAVDHGTLQNSGATVSGLSAGLHTITFTALNGWTTPASQVISVAANQTTSVTAMYAAIAPTGSLQVTLSPAVTQWEVDHGTLQNSGATLSGLSVGLHTITFSALNGWTTPASQTVYIVGNLTNSIAANYLVIPQPGSVQGTATSPTAQLTADKGASRAAPTGQIPSITANQRNTIMAADAAVVQMGGTYNGLFYAADAVTQATSGMLNGLIVKTNGTYSGKILIGGGSFAISGSFDVTGHASLVIPRATGFGGELTLDMTLTRNGALTGIVGAVSGTNGGPWTANLFADAAAASSHSYQYTLLFPPAATAPDGSPPGFGYATITNYEGTATLAGGLADGATFSQHVPVSADGSLPLYAAFGDNELLLGWVTNLYSQTPGGEIVWIKGASLKPVNYKQGFTNVISVMGSVWTDTAEEHASSDLSNAPLTLAESGGAEPLN